MFTIAFWTILNVYQSVIAEPIVVDRVIAVVNGEAILASELQTSLAIQSLTKAKGEDQSSCLRGLCKGLLACTGGTTSG